MKIIVVLLFALVAFHQGSAQEKNEAPKYGITISGFVKTDVYYDTWQSDASRAKTSGATEGEFFGTSESDMNGFRLRHTFVKMDWSKTTLLVGQFRQSMFPVMYFPGTVSFNADVQFTPFSRNPQIKLTKISGTSSCAITACSQRDFVSSCPDGNSNKYLRNSGLPGLNMRLRLPAGNGLTGWAGFDHKTPRPEIKTTANRETDETIESLSSVTTLKNNISPFKISLMGIFAQNASDLFMLGGYTVSSNDPLTQKKTYTNLNTGSIWADFLTNGKKVVFGLLTGYNKNLGASKTILAQYIAVGTILVIFSGCRQESRLPGVD